MSISTEVDPRRHVEVLEDGTLWPGMLRWWRRDGDRWLAFVDITNRPGITYVRWVPAERVREA